MGHGLSDFPSGEEMRNRNRLLSNSISVNSPCKGLVGPVVVNRGGSCAGGGGPAHEDEFDVVLGQESEQGGEIGHRLACWPARHS